MLTRQPPIRHGYFVETLTLEMYTGGLFETNAYYLSDPQILVDAPEGVANWLKARGLPVQHLLLTHGHVDHVWDAAEVQKQNGCEVYYHRETAPMVLDPDFFARHGFPWKVIPVLGGNLLGAAVGWRLGGQAFDVLEVPGHCPGSLCFYHPDSRSVFGGDVLFAGGVGRWDLPGGDRELLLSGIREKLFPLGDEVRVLPGHGPATTIGIERRGNPYLSV